MLTLMPPRTGSATHRSADYNAGHPASLAISPDLPLPDPIPFEDPAEFTSTPDLTPAEAAHFKREGFIVKRGLIDDAVAFDQVIDHIWSNVPRDLMRLEDSASWIDPPEDEWTEEDSLRVGLLMDNNWKMRSSGADGIGTEPFLVQQIATHPDMMQVVEALLGGTAEPVRRVRGIYCVFPSAPGMPGRYRPHADYMAAHLAAMILADDIGPRCGGFMLWPRSHIRLSPYWQTVHGSKMASDQAEPFLQAREAVIRDTRPLEFTGTRGDVVFWHPRTLHSAGLNHSAESGRPMVRVNIPCDYQRAGRAYYDDEHFGPGARYQWWIDTRNFAGDTAPSTDNMWDDWGV